MLLPFFALAVHAATVTATTVTEAPWTTVVGDPGMLSPYPATQWTGWSFCNLAAGPSEYGSSPSPRAADCVREGSKTGEPAVTFHDNELSPGTPIPSLGKATPTGVNEYARAKELYLGELCARTSTSGSTELRKWSGWSVMFKSGIMSTKTGLCPCVVESSSPVCGPKFAGSGDMNQPLLAHSPTSANGTGSFSSTYDVDANWTTSQIADASNELEDATNAWIKYREAEVVGHTTMPRPSWSPFLVNKSFLMASWRRNWTSGKVVYYSALKTSSRYPWLMNYLRANDVTGGYGGYPWQGAGNLFGPVPSETRMIATLRVIEAANGDGKDQFYLPEISGCWKLNGEPCDGDIATDVTRYICFIVATGVKGACSPTSQHSCPPYHLLSATGEKIFPNETDRFPYTCYHMHCYAPNDPDAPPNSICDPYSNPNPQELLQLLPCSEWETHGFPSSLGEGWVGDARTWTLDVGGLGSRVFLSGTEPQPLPPRSAAAAALRADRASEGLPGVNRSWISFEIGPEQMDPGGGFVRWEVEDWDVQVLS